MLGQNSMIDRTGYGLEDLNTERFEKSKNQLDFYYQKLSSGDNFVVVDNEGVDVPSGTAGSILYFKGNENWVCEVRLNEASGRKERGLFSWRLAKCTKDCNACNAKFWCWTN